MATNAYDELEEGLPGGAGTNLAAIVAGFSATNNAHAANAGQLKWLAAQFYGRLIEVDYTNAYPWTAATTDDVDQATANIGQMKYLFSFNIRSSISGSVSYSGPQTGQVWAVAALSSNSWSLDHSASLSAPGSYSIETVFKDGEYWVKAYRDTDGDLAFDSWEAHGTYASNPVAPSNSLSGINVVMTDPDDDSDALPDWWEFLYFGNLGQTAGADSDGDGLPNAQEYNGGTNSTSPWDIDSDGDGVADGDDGNPSTSTDSDSDELPDDWEQFWFGSLSQTGGGDYDSDGFTNLEEYLAGTDPTVSDVDDADNDTSLLVFRPLL